MLTASRDISRLLEIMQALRTPKTGCPWDLEQNFKTIAPYTIEEAYEVADAIEREDMVDLRLELGDLLLQSVYHAQLAKEEGHFDFGDVVEGICRKMIRRHPHVFGTEDVTAEEYSAKGMEAGTWERIKAEEKAEKLTQSGVSNNDSKAKLSLLDDVPANLPPLLEAVKLQKKASSVDFDWNDPFAVITKIKEEITELEEQIQVQDKYEQEGELGDLLFAIANLARHLKIDPQSALRRTNQKFRTRFGYIEQNIEHQKDVSLKDASLEVMDDLWNEAKSKV